ncbi:MAG: radical SAM protein, partial [Pygmaiobacter sp.]
TDRLLVSRAALHFWEEPCISGIGENAPGSGTVFFSGCSLGCCFCQNYQISRGAVGKEISVARLCEIFLELQQQGAANINLVTPDHFAPAILAALSAAKPALTLPIACNCSGYETLKTVRALAEQVDIFMPDLKFFDPDLSGRLAAAPDYFAFALPAICEMVRLCGAPVFDAAGLLRRGVIVRHLVLPGHREDSLHLLDALAAALPTDSFILSLMSQYTPYHTGAYPELNRRLSTFEYKTVTRRAEELGFDYLYTQQRSAAKEEYTPPFDFEGV